MMVKTRNLYSKVFPLIIQFRHRNKFNINKGAGKTQEILAQQRRIL